MRKKSTRTIRPIAKPLTAKQKTDLIIAPRMHLHLLLSGIFDLDYAFSLIGAFNLANVLAALNNKHDQESLFSKAQDLLLELMRERRTPSAIEGSSLTESFNAADRLITSQNTALLMKALAYTERTLPAEPSTGSAIPKEA